MNSTSNLETLIYHHFKTRDNLAQQLGVSRGSVQRWIHEDPKRFLYYTTEFENMGVDPKTSVVDPEFRLHGYKNIFAADSSIFPNAPGINPSLTIMALSKKAAADILRNI